MFQSIEHIKTITKLTPVRPPFQVVRVNDTDVSLDIVAIKCKRILR